VVAALTSREWPPEERGVFHLDDGCPPSIREIAEALSRSLGSPVPVRSVPLFVARAAIAWSGRGLFRDASRRSLAHRLFLASRDHFYDSSRLWALLGLRPGPPLVERLPRYVDWYRPFARAAGPEEGP
jgi:nucleoside-diphosphate-sugar epimerase